MAMRYRISGYLLASLLLSACGAGEPPPPPPAEPQGREETRSIRNTEAIGYAGDAIADKVDGALDANDERKARLDAEMDAQSE
jgi:hypothetical protein